jgi:hypothetical protein
MIKIIFVGIVYLLAATQLCTAAPVKGVVELFTSQGCSSCPPADKVFATLIQRDGIIGLAYHVDYWDYLNWKDTFSSKDATKRQYSYAKSFGTTQVFTPQMIVNGKEIVKATSSIDVLKAIDSMSKSDIDLPVNVSIKLRSDRVSVIAGQGSGDANLILIVFDTSETVTMESGENSGITVEYRNAVTSIKTIGMWKGKELSVELPRGENVKDKGFGCAVLLQRITENNTPGEIIGATIMSDATK